MRRRTPGGISVGAAIVWIVVYAVFAVYVFSLFPFQQVLPRNSSVETQIRELESGRQQDAERLKQLQAEITTLQQRLEARPNQPARRARKGR